MQQNSGGPPSRDNQAIGHGQNLVVTNNYRHQGITHELVDQTRPQPPQPVLHNPIPEGSNILGSARFEHLNVDADGSPSLLHGVNDIINPIQSGNHGEQHPVQASPSLHAHSSLVPSQGNEVPLHQGNRPRQPAPEREEWQQQETASGFGVDLRSGRYTSTSDINQDHPLGFSGANMNAQSSSHLTNLPSESINQFQNFHPEVHENCAEMMLPEPAVSALQAEHDTKWRKCYRSFMVAGYDNNIARHYADQLLSFQNIGEAVKCLHCGERGEMGKQFRHHDSCAVSLYQQALRQEWQGQLGPNDTGNNARTEDQNQRPSAVAAPLASGLSSSSQPASNQVPITQCQGAVGGVERRVPPNSSMYARGSNDGTCTHRGNNLRTWNNGQASQGPFLPPRASEIMAPSVSGLSLNPPPRSNPVPTTPSLGAVGGPQRTGSNQRVGSAYVDETRVKGSVNPGGAEMRFTHGAAGPDTSSLRYQTAEREVMARSHGRRGDMQQNQAPSSTSEFQPIPNECQIIIDMGYSLQHLQRALLEYQRRGGSTTNVNIQQLLDIIFKQDEQEHVINRPTMHSTGSYQSVLSSNERGCQSSHGSVRVDASLCGFCNLRKVRISQFHCGHVVCKECAPLNLGEPCKICREKVEKCVAMDPSVYEKNP